jgi:hypothetical protein
MKHPRQHLAAIPWGDKVLVFGGWNETGYLASIESYDPNTDAWSTAGHTAVPHAYHSVAAISNDEVLVLGGVNDAGVSPSEICSFPTGRCSITSPMASMHGAGHSCTVLSDGRVLLVGGDDNSCADAQPACHAVEVFTPSSARWETLLQLKTARRFHTATLLPDGRVLIAGGQSGSATTNAVDILDVANRQVVEAAWMQVPRFAHYAAYVPGVGAIALGGQNGARVLADVEVFDPTANLWRTLRPLRSPRENFMAVVEGQSLLLVGGANGVGFESSVERYSL